MSCIVIFDGNPAVPCIYTINARQLILDDLEARLFYRKSVTAYMLNSGDLIGQTNDLSPFVHTYSVG